MHLCALLAIVCFNRIDLMLVPSMSVWMSGLFVFWWSFNRTYWVYQMVAFLELLFLFLKYIVHKMIFIYSKFQQTKICCFFIPVPLQPLSQQCHIYIKWVILCCGTILAGSKCSSNSIKHYAWAATLIM